MQTIPLTKGYVAVVDGEDYERLAAFKWTARETRKTVYAARYQRKHEYGDGKKRIVLMHRQKWVWTTTTPATWTTATTTASTIGRRTCGRATGRTTSAT